MSPKCLRVPNKEIVGTSLRSQNWLCDFRALLIIRLVHVAESGLSLTLIITCHLVVRLWGRKYIAATHFQLAEPRDTQNSSTIVGPRD